MPGASGESAERLFQSGKAGHNTQLASVFALPVCATNWSKGNKERTTDVASPSNHDTGSAAVKLYVLSPSLE